MKFHDTLNEKIWDLNTQDLIPEVKSKLEEIADAFIEYIEVPQDAILDMVVTGSSASYNYNEFSDLDLHIIVDYDKVHEDCPLVNGYLNSLKKQFNDNHDIFIHGIPVELYAEQKDPGTVHNGLYSLQTGWIDKPQKIEPTDNDAAVEAKFNEIKEMVDKCDDSEEATELLEKIYSMRKAGLAEAGEFCTENLAFKKLRNRGCMDKLRQIKKEQIDKQLSLESYNSVNETLNSRQKELKKVFDKLLKEIHDFGGGKILDIKYEDGERPYYYVDIKNCGDWYKEYEDNEYSWDLKWSSYDKFRDIVEKYDRKYRKDKIECDWGKSVWFYEDKKIHIAVRDNSKKPHKSLFEGVEEEYSIKNESFDELEFTDYAEPVYHYSVEDIDKRGEDFDNAEDAYEQAVEDLGKLGYEVGELDDNSEFNIFSPSTGVSYTGVIYPSYPETYEQIKETFKNLNLKKFSYLNEALNLLIK